MHLYNPFNLIKINAPLFLYLTKCNSILMKIGRNLHKKLFLCFLYLIDLNFQIIFYLLDRGRGKSCHILIKYKYKTLSPEKLSPELTQSQ